MVSVYPRLLAAAIVYLAFGLAGGALIGDVGGPLWVMGILGLPIALLVVWFLDLRLRGNPGFQGRPGLLLAVDCAVAMALYLPVLYLAGAMLIAFDSPGRRLGGGLGSFAGWALLLCAPVIYLAWRGLQRPAARAAFAVYVLGALIALTRVLTQLPSPERKAGVPGGPPQLWSDHRDLKVSASECANQGVEALNSLGYANVVQRGTYAYGSLGRNRAAVHCVERSGGSFVYLSVAGPRPREVEKLRNEIAWKMM